MGGMYVNGSIGGQPMEWLIDTGCNVAIMSQKVYARIPIQEWQKLSPCEIILTQANGESLNVAGQDAMTFRLERQKFHFEVIVADCETDGLLGLEFLGKSGGLLTLVLASWPFVAESFLPKRRNGNIATEWLLKQPVWCLLDITCYWRHNHRARLLQEVGWLSHFWKDWMVLWRWPRAQWQEVEKPCQLRSWTQLARMCKSIRGHMQEWFNQCHS